MADLLKMSGLEAHAHFLITNGQEALACGFFARSKTKVRGIAANFGKRTGRYGWNTFQTESERGWTGIFTPVNMGRDRFTYCLCTNKDIGNRYLITTPEEQDDDLFEYLMLNYKLPLKREWVPSLRKLLIEERLVSVPRLTVRSNKQASILLSLNGKDYNICNLVCYDFFCLKEEDFENLISSALATKRICITEKDIPPLEFQGMDEYFKKYGCKVVDNLDKSIEPLVDLRANVTNLALKVKSLFPQQAASVEGVLAMKRHGIKYAVLNHGMGCGKTIETAAAMESAMVSEWLEKNPGKTLRDAYAADGVINYRAIIMAPGHLVAKWAQEIADEIPYAKTTIINQFSQLVAIREAGRKANGKEFFVISKDFCKLDTQMAPIPTQIKKKYLALDICQDCKQEEQKIVFKKGIGTDACCPDCQGTNFEVYPLSYLARQRGLICPKCGELLMEYKRYNPDAEDFDEIISKSVLTPDSFAKARSSNSTCYHCGAPLWGANAKPLVLPGCEPREPKWYKVSHFANHTKKSKISAFVLKGKESDYFNQCITKEGLSKSSMVYGPRKVAPAHYIKRYLKGYFDFCVLDECHKYLGDSAQAVAAHTLIKASKFTLALTGTISNGTAASFYNLFWMLEPSRMVNMGYHYGDSELMRFCREYGCVETVYEASASIDHTKNVNSRGKQLSPPRVKPGISPVLFGRLLMDRCLFLDISDLSKYLPKLKERVVLLEPPADVLHDYKWVLDVLKEASHGELGMAALSTMLQFGLSYLDKPYGRAPIMNPYCKDSLICRVPNHDKYASLDNLTSKEEKLIELVNQEMSESRNVFVYATFTGTEESNVSYRLKSILEKYCNLEGRVDIIHSTSPVAAEREAHFHKRAAEGIKVFITNPMNVETGLDFCFKHDGKTYNYPTLIFYQTSYSLATIWQASRRAYRLNQKEECRVFYLAYENTLQAAAIDIMARKQVATAAIQGHFSAEGLSAMAKGVDARTQLAQALAKDDMSDRESLENMFDALAEMNETYEEDAAFCAYKPSLTFYELLGYEPDAVMAKEDPFAQSFSMQVDASLFDVGASFFEAVSDVSVSDDFESFFAGFGFNVAPKTLDGPVVARKKGSKKPAIGTQVSLFDFAI